MKYLLLVCFDPRMEFDEDAMAAGRAWMDEMTERGTRLYGDRLRPANEAITVRRPQSEVLVCDGPYAETKEQIGGFDLIDCKDLDEAIEIAAKHPVARYGTVEIRPIWPM